MCYSHLLYAALHDNTPSTLAASHVQREYCFHAGMVNWARSRDPILQRYGVGGVARAAVASDAGFAAVQEAGGLEALVSALSEDDPQAQCFAAAALGEHFGSFNIA